MNFLRISTCSNTPFGFQCRNVRTWVVFGLNDRRQGLVERQEAWQDKLNLSGVEYRGISL